MILNIRTASADWLNTWSRDMAVRTAECVCVCGWHLWRQKSCIIIIIIIIKLN